MLYLYEGNVPPTQEGQSKSNAGGQVWWGITHLWKGTRLIENQYVYIYKICISKF